MQNYSPSPFGAVSYTHLYSRPNLEDEHLSKETRDSLAYLFERHYTWNTNLEAVSYTHLAVYKRQIL